MNNTKIYIVSHKIEEDVNDIGYEYLHVGDKCKEHLLNCDNTGDNISDKNKNYCELTALYWIWKNTNYDNVGLVHYRRFFLDKTSNIFFYRYLKINNINNILLKYDIILPKIYTCKETLYLNYTKHHYGSDLDEIREVVKEIYPDYLSDYDYIIYNQNNFYTRNMFIGKKKIVDDYCKWLFDILFTFENKVNFSNRDDYQKRIFGFLSERLINVWLYHNKPKIKEVKIGFTQMSPFKDFLRRNVSKIIQFFR